jgi:hypothetical protein
METHESVRPSLEANELANVERIDTLISDLGLVKFVELFIDHYKNEDFLIDPEEFFGVNSDEYHIAGITQMQEDFHKAHQKFICEFYKANMVHMGPKVISRTIGPLLGRDIPESVYEALSSKIPPK